MELNLEKGYIQDAYTRITLDRLLWVEKLTASFGKIHMEFVAAERDFARTWMSSVFDSVFYRYLYLYDDVSNYERQLRLLKENYIEVVKYADRLGNEQYLEQELWKCLLTDSYKRGIINPHNDCLAQKFSPHEYSKIMDFCGHHASGFTDRVENLKEAYQLLVSVLPENMEKTRKNMEKKEAEKKLESLTELCGENIEDEDACIARLEQENGQVLEKWEKTVQKLKDLKDMLLEIEDRKLFEAPYTDQRKKIIEACLSAACERVDKLKKEKEQEKEQLNKKKLFDQYGPVSNLKKVLRDSVNRLDFMELLDLYKEYKEQEEFLNSFARRNGCSKKEPYYKEYMDIYRLGSVLISHKMNELNRNKAKRKYIPQDLLDEALLFYYEVDSVQDAYAARSDEQYSQQKESGEKGEQKVEYALKWIDSSFTKIERKSKDRVGNQCIYICNPDFIDEAQEYDHLLVSPHGVISIETKNYAGKLCIDAQGNWIRKKNGEEEGIKNPLQQIRQHEKVLRSFLPETCRVISVICIANDKAIIEGIENSPIPIVKSDMLVEFLEKQEADDAEPNMTDQQKEQIMSAIYEHIIE